MRAALVYASRLNWRVVPIHEVRADGSCSCGKSHLKPDGVTPDGSAGKHPRMSDWVDQASNDPAEIEQWIARWPSGNLGVATGDASGFWVLDVDTKKDGAATLAALEAESGFLPPTVQALTPTGGAHYLFRLPGFAVTNSASSLGAGLDVRGNGGQIVVAPSRTAVGAYTWVRAPWDFEIAEAPEWLLRRLGRAPATNREGLRIDRGFFPAAKPEVLDQAREALEQHGPAIDGEGGGLHTVQAAAILTHDYALTDDEAWPLFLEWNKTCVPPWEESDLRVRLYRGRKYGKAEYGCKRALDVLEITRKIVADWEAAGRGEEAMVSLVARGRTLAEWCGDTVRRAIIQRELQAATNLGARDLSLPAVRNHTDEELPPNSIEVTTRLHEVADESIKAIAPHVFARNGVLCEVVRAERTYIHDLDSARIQDLMSRAATYVRHDEKAGIVTQAAPGPVAAILASRRSHPASIRVLEAVTTAPVFLSDGSILQTRGYNAKARVFLEPSVAVDVPEDPSHEDAIAAVDVFRDLLCDFKFAEQADFSSWLAGLLSPLVKAATGNAPAPMLCVSASSPAAGKTLLTDVIARIVTGAGAEIRSYNPKDPGEWGKRLTAYVKAASPVNVFDNVNGPFGPDEALDRLITATTWSDRLLGASEAPPLPVVGSWYATGNNIEPVGDTVRRVLMCRIEVDVERPQERTGFKRPLLADYAQEHRSELLSAALTILRAYHVAGRPSQNLPAWGSFTAWSEIVRAALVWASLPDPFLTQRRAAAELNEPENDSHDFWLGVVEASDGGGVASVVTLANQRGAQEVLGCRDQITAHSLKRFVGRFVDKPRAGKRIRRERDARTGAVTYSVEWIG